MPLQMATATSFLTEKFHRPAQNATDAIVGPVLAKLSGLTSDYRQYHGSLASEVGEKSPIPSPITSPIRHKDVGLSADGQRVGKPHEEDKRSESRLASRIGLIEESYERSHDSREGKSIKFQSEARKKYLDKK